MIRGVDVSVVQASVDWRALRLQGISFAFIKAAEHDWQDQRFRQHLADARATGMIVGPYLVPHPSGDPEVQASAHYAFAEDCGAADGDLPPALDLEVPGTPNPGQRLWFLAYGRACAKLWRTRPLIYEAPWWWSKLGGPDEPAFAAEFGLWQAAYTTPAPHDWPADGAAPPIARPWTSWLFWQWIGGKELEGAGLVDCDVFGGTEAEFTALRSRRQSQDVQELARVGIEQAAGELPVDPKGES